MDAKDLYGDYLNCLKTIVSLIDKGEADQNQIEQIKRDTENDIDKKYNNLLSNIVQAKRQLETNTKAFGRVVLICLCRSKSHKIKDLKRQR